MTRLALWIRQWPVTLRVPLVVALLMVVVSAAVSERVLTRLAETQSRHLSELGDAYLDGLSSSLIPAVLRRDVWEAFDTLDRAAGLYRGLELVGTVVADANGTVLAASDPKRIPTGSELSGDFAEPFPPAGGLRADVDSARTYLQRDLLYQDRVIGSVYAELDIAHLIQERRDVLTALILTNSAITVTLAFLGYVAVTRMVRPLRVLADHLRQGADGEVRAIPESKVHGGAETRRLFRSYNGLVEAVSEREALTRRLAEEEKLASLGRLASGMAHEINNPLGGLFNAIDTLKHHGEAPSVRRASLDLLERGLVGIREVVQAALVSYRSEGDTRPLRAADLDDVRLLIGPELRRRSQSLNWSNEIEAEIPVSAAAVRQALLNLMLNACAASPAGSVVAFAARAQNGRLLVTIDDSGAGMPEEARAYLTSSTAGEAPFGSGRNLGLWLVRRLADEIGAAVHVTASELGGTRMSLDVPYERAEALYDAA